MPNATVHVPVMCQEVVDALDARPGKIIVDGTLGGGGHARLLAERVAEGGRVIALDRDPAVISQAAQLAQTGVTAVQANYCELPRVLNELQITSVDGVLLDLGLSTDQLADAGRGFSFDADGPLDLRFDPDDGEPAWRLLARIREKDLADLIYQFGEERHSRKVARSIVARRKTAPIRTAADLAEAVRRVVPRSRGHRIDPATRTFQALRIAVNDELGSLERGLKAIPECLAPGGRMVVISFHSLEDRLVKHAFKGDERLRPLTKKPIRPSEEECHANPASRSAKLRAAERAAKQ